MAAESFSKKDWPEDQEQFISAMGKAIESVYLSHPNGVSMRGLAAYLGMWLGENAKMCPPDEAARIRQTFLMNFDDVNLPDGSLG